MVINTCRKCALPVIVNRMPLALSQLALHHQHTSQV
jgi:hypothetical protein